MTSPRVLYRAFTTEHHASEFVAGRFRMGRLDQYREIENSTRIDPAEGLGHYVDGLGVHEHFELGNPIYVLCCSSEDVDLSFLKWKMGPFVVKIASPSQLATDITGYFINNGMKIFGNAKCRTVEYTKGSRIEDALDPMARAELSVVQKSQVFSEEKEQRFFVIANVSCSTRSMPSHIDVSLHGPLSYAEILRY